MNVDFIITSNCDKAVEAYRKMEFQQKSDREYQKHFLSLTKVEQREIMYAILVAQAETLRENIKQGINTTLHGLGTFKYREGKARANIFKDKLANQYGFDTFRDIDNEALKVKILATVNAIKKEEFISEHIERIKLGRSYSKAKVYTSFSYKDRK